MGSTHSTTEKKDKQVMAMTITKTINKQKLTSQIPPLLMRNSRPRFREGQTLQPGDLQNEGRSPIIY